MGAKGLSVAPNPDWPQVFGVSFEIDTEVAVLPLKSLQITKTGMYNLYFIHCDTRLKELVVEGKTVITLGMFEMALWYFDYAEFSETGIRATGTTIWAVTFGTAERTVAHLVILMVMEG
ncbi:hypothetical protein V8G54_035261 [Vigna mungo]|uniref:GOST seven transmembrane domain-containing protein n=1 Tax=Vigna mungo TaxID=3915 RepID=A0AAQ3MEV9_VIGMU